MMSLSIFILENNIVNLIGRLAVDKDFETTIFSFSNPIGITIYLLMQIVLGYVLSRFLINTRRKSKEFLKNGNYFEGIYPGKHTTRFFITKSTPCLLVWFNHCSYCVSYSIILFITCATFI